MGEKILVSLNQMGEFIESESESSIEKPCFLRLVTLTKA